MNKKENKKTIFPKKWYKLLLNKFTIVTILFIVWMIFFDQNSYFIHKELDEEIKTLKIEKKQYEERLEKETIQLKQIQTDPEEIERIAREKHLLRKENEDVFIIEERKVKNEENDEPRSE